MAAKSHRSAWLVWLIGSLGAAAALGYTLFEARDKTVFMPGELSPGHHQLAESCDACHRGGFSDIDRLQEACVECHGAERVKPFDSHPRTKFTDPRNADRLEKIDALHCVTCHKEHRPEITRKNGVTQPEDVCFNCHSEIAEDRPSHTGMPFDTCASAGCHNFHNNRALYTDFLVKHMDDPATRAEARLPLREFAAVLEEIYEYPHDRYPVQPLTKADMDAPPGSDVDPGIALDWAQTAHARSGVNCGACHRPSAASGEPGVWRDKPGQDACATCHGVEITRFGKGKHGMRGAAGLTPMRPELAMSPMHEDAAHRELTCDSCHPGHRFDTAYAATEACLECHNDRHSLAYEGTEHHRLWLAELAGEGEPGSGVSCASCHMPRIDYDVSDWMSRKIVDHNQSATLSPNSKMIRPACLHCHGLGFSIDALADRELIERNFDGSPTTRVQSLSLARADQERYLREKAEAAQ